jgi:SAM-dependent methyltransferase
MEDVMQVPENWWKDFFSGMFVEVWLRAGSLMPTAAEADFIEKMLSAPNAAKLLDVPCGAGRLALELAARGYEVTGADLSAEFLVEATRRAQSRGLTLTWHHGEMRRLPWQDVFDGAFCFGNSFGYLDDEGDADFLRAVAGALKPGSRFVLDTKSAETIFPRFHEREWYELEDLTFLEHQEYDPVGGRINTEYTLMMGDRTEKRLGSERLYTYRRIHEMLTSAGFTAIQAFGSLAGEPFRLGSERLLIVAAKAAR